MSSELIDLLKFLLPGFLSAWVYQEFTSRPNLNQFERTIQALIFTLIVHTVYEEFIVLAQVYESSSAYVQKANNASLYLTTIALIIGFLFASFSNNDLLHSVIRKLKISKETSYPSEWYGEFSRRVTYIVLHFKNGRRLYGWPKEWPSNPQSGHFAIEQVSWLLENGEELPIDEVASVLVPANEIELIEFMNKTWREHNNG